MLIHSVEEIMDDDHHSVDLTDIAEAILLLRTKSEVESFLMDLCTPQEIKALRERWYVCQLLHSRKLSYRTISELTGVSTTTITRVSRFLNDEPYHGYRTVLERMEKNVENANNNDDHAVERTAGLRKAVRR
ncbi:MAG: trp operon repressor [Holosporaceae bacterium]|jgi:TrpR-related protein YerC/YecD|nr:trp operon repressor [Holosporaceae bacterium]